MLETSCGAMDLDCSGVPKKSCGIRLREIVTLGSHQQRITLFRRKFLPQRLTRGPVQNGQFASTGYGPYITELTIMLLAKPWRHLDSFGDVVSVNSKASGSGGIYDQRSEI
jgi:hypothetical protein